MKRKAGFVLALLCLAVCLPLNAQQQKKKYTPNVSLNIGKTVRDSLKVPYVNIGLLSNIHALKGLGLNVVSSVVRTNASGMQVSGLANICGQNAAGFQLAGITNVNGYDVKGWTASGLLNITGSCNKGVAFSGMANVAGKSSVGLSASGLVNIAGDSFQGVALSGLSNIAANNSCGVALSGLSNVCAADVDGMQVASLLNVSGGSMAGMQLTALGNVGIDVTGMQVAGLANIAVAEMKGMQIAPANYAARVRGIQVGLANVCGGKVGGMQIGLFNYSRDSSVVKLGLVNMHPGTRVQMMVYGGNMSKLNLGVRFLNRWTYTILAVGSPYLHWDDKFSGSVSYRAGLHWCPVSRLRLSGDLGYGHIENFRNESAEIPRRMYALQARVNVECRLAARFGLFVSGGYGTTRYYDRDKTFEKKPIIEAGILLF